MSQYHTGARNTSHRLPAAAAAAEFGVAGVVLATRLTVGAWVDEGDADSAVRNTRLGIRKNMQAVADIHVPLHRSMSAQWKTSLDGCL